MNGGQVCSTMIKAFQTNETKQGSFFLPLQLPYRLYQFSLGESLITSLVEQSQS